MLAPAVCAGARILLRRGVWCSVNWWVKWLVFCCGVVCGTGVVCDVAFALLRRGVCMLVAVLHPKFSL